MGSTKAPEAPIIPEIELSGIKRANKVPVIGIVLVGIFSVAVLYFMARSRFVGEQSPAVSAKGKPALDSARNILARAPSGVIESSLPAVPTASPLARYRAEKINTVNQRSVELRAKALESTGVVPVVNREARTFREAAAAPSNLQGGDLKQHTDINSRIQELLNSHEATVGVESNDQDQKQAFRSSIKDAFELDGQIVEPKGFREIKTGSVIPAVLITGINSDLPGELIAQVSQDVFDSVSGDVLLLPAGTRLFGRYDSQVVYGQSRVLVVWDRLVHPDGRALALQSMLGADATGASGFADEVHSHYGRIFGSALLMSVISAGVQLSQPNSRPFGGYDAQQQIAASLGQQMGQVGMQVTRKNLDVQPTIAIRPGLRFNILVNKDIVIPERAENSQ